MAQQKHIDVKKLIFSPADVAANTVQMVDGLRQDGGGGIPTGILDLDRDFRPMRGGELITVMGYASWGKSTLMDSIASYVANTYCATGDVVIKVTWEQSVEEDCLGWIATQSGIGLSQIVMGVDDNQWKIIMQAYGKRIDTPIWIMGHSLIEAEREGSFRPRMTMNDVIKGVELIRHGLTDEDHRIRLVVLDYLQRIRPDPEDGNDRRLQVSEAVNKAKDLGIHFHCPVLLGCQAGRHVLDRENPLPRIDDGQETSNIEQTSDRVISLWYPWKTEESTKKIDIAGTRYQVKINLLVAAILKQKFGKSPVTLPLFIDPERRIIGSLEHRLWE